jgi:hypothetical protein
MDLQITAVEEVEPAGDGIAAALGTDTRRLRAGSHSAILWIANFKLQICNCQFQ